MAEEAGQKSALGDEFRVGEWLVQPRLNRVSNRHRNESLERKVMETLVLLASQAGNTVTREQLIEQLWNGAHVTEDALNRSISKLRKAFGDDPKQPTVIETIPKVGYRPIAAVTTETLHVVESNGHVATAEPTLKATRRFSLGWIVGSSLLLLLVAVWWWRQPTAKSLAQRNLTPSRIVPFTSFPGLEVSPALSPDGSQVAFAWKGEANDNWDIYLKPIATESLVRLTRDAVTEMEPAWSPDGSQIAFVRRTKTACGIYAITPRGEAERKLTACQPGNDISLSWSPDGKWLAFTDKTAPAAPAAVFLLALATGERRQLTAPPTDWLFGDSEVAFAPDSLTLAFVRYSAIGVADVFLLPVTGGEPRRLTFDNLKVHGLAWQPDGQHVLYSSNRGGSFGLWQIAGAGGAPERVTTDGRSAEQPTLTRQRMVYEQWLDETNLWQINLQNATEQAVTTSTRWDEYPRYSPDGQRIAFVSDRSGAAEIWVCKNDGTESVRLTSFHGPYARAPRWSPDGRQIAFDTSHEGNFDVYIVNATGGAPRRLMTDASEEHVADWSRDGRWLYFTSNRSGSWQIWKMSAGGEAAVQVTRNGGFAASESHDGQWLYFTHRGKAGLWRMPGGGGEETVVLNQLQPLDWLNWTLTPTGIYFITRPTPDVPQLAFYEAQSQQTRALQSLPRLLYKSGLSVAPDGKTLLYTKLEKSEADLILMDSFAGNDPPP
jgi:Tol biopolymer transport system component/DNA-binding winged helix-turn-helix (wHTH) protein